MTESAIQVDGLSKRYRLGGGAGVTRTFREMLYDQVATVGNRLRGRAGTAASMESPDREFWALRDVSFDVRAGEVLGIIGRNGAGKSTLLKILSRITDPTAGQALIRGRVGSLLEVGTGFHPELSGRENIYLNGAVLGMRKAEIQSRFDEIVAFAEVERFLDTPVKRYSSGMYVRLAFAVAAHLEPEVLIVDEVLAVGDAAFQKRCLGRMSQVARDGRTVLFVSHNMTAVRNLCGRAVLLDQGRVTGIGPADQMVTRYMQQCMDAADGSLEARADRRGDGSARITDVRIENAEGNGPIASGCRLRVTLQYQSPSPLRGPRFLVAVYDTGNTGLYLLDSDSAHELPELLPPQGKLICITDPINVTPGRCYVNIALKLGGALADHVTHAARFDVESGDTFGMRHMPTRDWVMCLLRQQWQLERSLAA